MSDWQERYAHVLDDLDPEQRELVVASIQNSVLSGWEPTDADVRVMVSLTLGEITTLQAFADFASRRGERAREARQSRSTVADDLPHDLEAWFYGYGEHEAER